MQLPPPESRPRTVLTCEEFNALVDRLSEEQIAEVNAYGNDVDGMLRHAANFYNNMGGAAGAAAAAAVAAAPAVAAPAVAAVVPAVVQPPAPAPMQQPLAYFLTPCVGDTPPTHDALMALRVALEEHKQQAVHAQELIGTMVGAQRSIATAAPRLGDYGDCVQQQCAVLQAAMFPPGDSGRMGFRPTAQMQWCDSMVDVYDSMLAWVDERLAQLMQ